MATRHKKDQAAEYQTWRSVKNRCLNPSCPSYPEYGGAGITICERWRGDFWAFFADMGRKPSPKHSIDRYPDQRGNYEPGNCRWATAREQCLNRSSNVLVEYRGRTMTVVEWSEELGWNYTMLMKRLRRCGMDAERAFAIPRRKTARLEHDGRSMTYAEWAAETGIPADTIRSRITVVGWSVADALTIPNKKFMGRHAKINLDAAH